MQQPCSLTQIAVIYRRASVDPEVLQVKKSLDRLNRLFKGDASG